MERPQCYILQAAFNGQGLVSALFERVCGPPDDACGPVIGGGDARAAKCGGRAVGKTYTAVYIALSGRFFPGAEGQTNLKSGVSRAAMSFLIK